MLKKGIWFILYIAGVTAIAVSLLITMLFFDEYDFTSEIFTSSASYEWSTQLLNDLRIQASGVWHYYDAVNALSIEETAALDEETEKYHLFEKLYDMGYTDEEIYNELIFQLSDEQINLLAEYFGIESELIQKILLEQKDVLISQREGAKGNVSAAGERSMDGDDGLDVASDAQVTDSYGYESTNLRYEIRKEGMLQLTNTPSDLEEHYFSGTYREERDGMELTLFLNTDYPVDDWYVSRAAMYNQFQSIKWILAGIMAGSLMLVIMSIVALSFCAGKKKDENKIFLSWIDKPPVEIAIVFWVLVAMGLGIGVFTLSSVCFEIQSMLSLIAFAGGVVIASAMSMIGYLSLVRRIKSHTLWKNSICYKVALAIKKFFGKLNRVSNVSQRVLTLSCGYAIVVLLLAIIGGRWAIILMVAISVIMFFFMYRDAISRQHILEAARKISSGELDYQIDLKEVNSLQLDVAHSINQVGTGIQKAVQQSIKDERLRTDLITNVSHDIKTPLTSIINYVDLLKREEIQNEKAQGYLAILEQKSQRLKQLTEDLVEASKLSSGNVVLDLEQMDFNEILQQALGEFEEKFQERFLQVVLKRPEGHVYVLAEGRRMWRILENLFQNVYKYAMPATRVYAILEKDEESMLFTLKNISEYSLSVEAEDLTERFIRGDVARSTEGSGLGLSIAKNLTTLQNGEFHIHLDGDLFKVTLRFDLIVENQ